MLQDFRELNFAEDKKKRKMYKNSMTTMDSIHSIDGYENS